MKKLITISTILLLSSSFLAGAALADRVHDENRIASHNIYSKIGSIKGTRYERPQIGAKERRLAKYLKKDISQHSWMAHEKISKIDVSGNKGVSTDKIKAIAAPFLSHGVTAKELKLLTDAIEDRYHKDGYFLPVAHAKIDGSTLKISVIEGKIKDVFVMLEDEKRDKKILTNQRFLDYIQKIETASPLKTKDLERYLLLINKIHGYTGDYELEPISSIKGNAVADLVMIVETKRGTANVSVDNAGTSSLGTHQLTFASQFFNPIANDSLVLNGGTSEKPKRFKMITGGYLKRLNSYGTAGSLFASYMEDDPYSTSGSKDSKSTVLRARLDQYLILNNDYSAEIEVGAEKRDMEYYQTTGSTTTKTMDYKYIMGSANGKIKIVDPTDTENWFYPSYNWALKKVSYSPSSSSDRNFDKDFNYFIIDWQRNQSLPKDFSLFLKASYQYTNKKLPLEHIYSVGTAHTGRGYKTGLVSSDKGAAGSAELRYTKDFEQKKVKKFLETAQPFAFYDVTHFIKHNKSDDRHHTGAIRFDKSTLPAAGAGLRLHFPYGFYGEGTAAYPFLKHITVNGTRQKNKPIYRFLFSKDLSW